MSEIPSALGLPAEQVAALLQAAGRAPSLHNAQPWRFRLTPQAIELHADPARRLPRADPQDRELRLGCGAALFNLRTALLGLGVQPVVTLLPDPDRPELLANVGHGGQHPRTPEIDRLRAAIPRRHTNRRPFTDTPLIQPEQHALCRAALDEGAWLHIVDDLVQRARLSRLAARAHDVQMADPAFRAELAAWTGDANDRSDGVPVSAGGPLPELQDKWVLRDFTGGQGRPRVAGKDFEAEPLIAVLGAHLSGPSAEIQAGQALQRVLLTATVHGLSVSFLSQLVEVPDIRQQMQRMISATRPPQIVLRVGHGWPVAGLTPRRPVEDLVLAQSAPSH
ncbi:Acg family FMN-binding oxidoreductase [Pseudonocardia bannensis]|uniref:Nitroreductase n=1 Tax=Pseudonocardia bannensis TaxID=630973 RepID=A0A848DEN3_9PSEU|nr:nitroreductase family protein [Pseudonocardia bannensis]NMH91072.1 nitroreductase [Pseudonocardia bannensis]